MVIPHDLDENLSAIGNQLEKHSQNAWQLAAQLSQLHLEISKFAAEMPSPNESGTPLPHLLCLAAEAAKHVPPPGIERKKSNCTSAVAEVDEESNSPSPAEWQSATTPDMMIASQAQNIRTSNATTTSFQSRSSFRRRQFWGSERAALALFTDPEDLKAKIRDILTEDKPTLDEFLYSTGCAQALARSELFQYVSLLVVVLSCLWLAVEIEFDKASVLTDAEPVFQIVAHLFCAFFVFELLVRILAFRRKAQAFKEANLLFDTFLVALIVLETWVISLTEAVIGFQKIQSAKVFTVLRLLRLTRVFRVARVVREFSQVLVIIKGLVHAFRAIIAVLMLLTFLIYMAAVVFKVMFEGTEVGARRFSSIPHSMGSLLLDGTLNGARGGPMIREAYSEHIIYAAGLLGFVVLSNVTIMGILGGLLVRTVTTVADLEKEEISVKSVTDTISTIWMEADKNRERHLVYHDLCNLVADEKACKLLGTTGVDLDGLVNISASIFRQHGGSLTKAQFTRLLLDLRGNNVSRVKDHTETRRFICAELSKVNQSLKQ